MTASPAVDADRLWADIMALAAVTEPDRPYTRRSFTPRFRDGRALLADRFAAAGLEVRTDAAGNLIGRRPGEDGARTIMLGSHSDTVPSGGRFDGIAGVAAALEIARALKGTPTRHAVEIVDYLAEEPSVFGLSCIGSRAIAGQLDDAMLGREAEGRTLAAAIDAVGGDAGRIAEARRSDVAMALELHIEQGRVLEEGRTTLGIVTAIAGIVRIEIVFRGRADHAGTTPMHLRRDALLPAADTASGVAAIARDLARSGDGLFVATTGVIEVHPNAANVIPGECRMVVEARAESARPIRAFLDHLDGLSRAAASRHGAERATYRLLSRTAATPCDPGLRRLLVAAAASRGISTVELASGAGHDTAFLASIAPAAMVFVPSRDGRSHAPEEWSDPAPIAAGAAVMLDTLLAFDREPS